MQLARAVCIAGHAQIQRVTDVRAKLDRVVPLHARPVVHELNLLFAFCQRAVAAADVQAVPKRRKSTVAIHEEGGQTTRVGCAEIEAGNLKRSCPCHVGIGVRRLRIVFEPSEPEVSEPLGANRLVKARCQTVVMNVRTAVQTTGAKTNSTEHSKPALTGQREVIEAEAAEDLVVPRCVVVHANVERFLVKRTSALRYQIVGRITVGQRCWKKLQDIQRLSRESAHRNKEWRGTCRRRWVEYDARRSAECSSPRAVQVGAARGVINVVGRISRLAISYLGLIFTQIAKT